MNLSKYERLNLVNQYLILEKLYPDDQEMYEKLRIALEKGYEFHYDDAVEWFHDEFPKENSNFVLDVLDMYRHITFSYENLEDKDGIEAEKIKFPGFDGNNETAYLGYTRYFIKDLGRFTELEGEFQDFNSHRQMMNKYYRMLEEWEVSDDKFNLTSEDIKRILNAR